MGKSLVHLPHQQKRIKGEEGAGLTQLADGRLSGVGLTHV